jgi:hypothetical protein
MPPASRAKISSKGDRNAIPSWQKKCLMKADGTTNKVPPTAQERLVAKTVRVAVEQ